MIFKPQKLQKMMYWIDYLLWRQFKCKVQQYILICSNLLPLQIGRNAIVALLRRYQPGTDIHTALDNDQLLEMVKLVVNGKFSFIIIKKCCK